MNEIEVNLDSIDNTKRKLLEELNNILEKYDYLIKEINDSKEIFDTNTSLYLRENINDNINSQKDYINNSLIPYINELDNVKNIYTESISEIKKGVNF